jgi:hypothetical protein
MTEVNPANEKLKEPIRMNSTSLFDMIVSACSEDRATLESDPSAVAGGRPIGRRYFLAAAFTFFKYRDTPKAVNSCHSNWGTPGKTLDFLFSPNLNFCLFFGAQCRNIIKINRCPPCLRTPVHHVPGLYTPLRLRRKEICRKL